jgi:hypothetical protein
MVYGLSLILFITTEDFPTLTYRQRHMVFPKKKELKGHVDKTFISENLTRHRYHLLNRLNTLLVGRKIHSPMTNESVSIGVFTTLLPFVGTLTLLNLKLVLLEYFSCSSSLFSIKISTGTQHIL